MKKKGEILHPSFVMVALAALMIMILPFMAHHHHGSVICSTQERCNLDHSINDKHTHHHKNEAHCQKAITILSPSSNTHNTVNPKHFPLDTILYGVFACMEVNFIYLETKQPSPTKTEVCSFVYGTSGLRAPPERT